jgi:hypothetical protein
VEPAVIVALAGAIIAGGVVVVLLTRPRTVHSSWASAAEDLGLRPAPGSAFHEPRIEGMIDGLPVRLDVVRRDHSGTSIAFTRYRVWYPPLKLGLRLTRESSVSRVLHRLGAPDIDTGHTDFDDTFTIHANSAEAARAFLTPVRRNSLLRLMSLHRDVVVEDNGITLTVVGVERDPERLVTFMRRTAATARQLAGRDAAPVLDEGLSLQRQGDLAAAAHQFQAAGRAHPDDLDARLLEAQALLASGAEGDAAGVVADLSAALPADVDVLGMKDRIETPPVPAAASPSPVELSPMLDDLFSHNRLSFETGRRFDEQYRGSPVKLSGRVKSAREYDRDLDFGDRPGAKAVVTIATIHHDLYGANDVDAVVQLPPGSAEHLRRGDQITFAGTLAKVDPMMRNLFVADGTVIG